MSEKLTRFFASRWGIILAGAVIGVLAPLLQYAGNPKNMGICVACFERDIAGALGLHRAAVVQYIRPEIIDLVENVSDVIYVLDESGVVSYVSPAARSVGGYDPPEVIGRSLAEFVHPDDLSRVQENFRKALSGHVAANAYRIVAKSGETRWVRASSRRVCVGDRVVAIQGVLADITERVQAAEALRESRDTIRALYQRVESAREQERARIAKDIHDEIIQPLIAVLYQADLLDIEPEKVEALSETLDAVNDRCRALIRNLHPPELDWPLAEAIQALPTTGIWLEVDSQVDSDVEASLPLDLKLATYRVIQEAVNNAVKHAGPSQVTVHLELSDQQVRFGVVDDGCGFDVAGLEKPEHATLHTGGFGLSFMRERIAALDGELHIESQPGSGTRVRATIPLPAESLQYRLDAARA